MTSKLQNYIEQAASQPEITSIILRLGTPGTDWCGAAGRISATDNRPAKATDAFVIHSVTKPFTSVCALIAMEQNLLSLDDLLCDLLPPSLVESIHILNGENHSRKITVRQLLGHQTGLPDYFFDGGATRETAPFQKFHLTDPQKIWEPEELIEWTQANIPPLFAPGNGYHYADTNYVLAGLILEEVYGMSLSDIFKTNILEPLQMTNTWMLFREPSLLRDGQNLTHVYQNDLDLATLTSMSSEWAGGGLVSTSQDLQRFLKGIFKGELSLNPSTFNQLTLYRNHGAKGYYSLGLMKYLSSGMTIHGHDGFGGAFMYYESNFDIFLTGTTNQAVTDMDFIGPLLELILSDYL